MELKSFSVKNFRSITEAHKINFGTYSVLIGKNNEGKSNLLNALSICMEIMWNPILLKRKILRSSRKLDRGKLYDWERDFPINLQNRKKGLKTIFMAEYYLSELERVELNNKLKTRLSSNDLTVKIEIDPNNEIGVKILKKGTKSLTEKSIDVMEFISRKITFNYIPAIRQEYDSIRIIESSISREFRLMEDVPEYKSAMDIIRNLQKEKLDKIGIEVKTVLEEFIPKITEVKIGFESESIYNRITLRDLNIMINDGNLTNIEQKGDGIKSLIALAMLKNKTNDDTVSIIAIDEPEAHLHAGAITELSKTLKSLVNDNQVIVCTHNPIFMDKEDIKNNIVISNGKVKPAKNTQEIRELLGIKMSDNLINAENILLVEGENDKIILTSILKKKSKKIKKSIEDEIFTIIPIGGASKLSYNLNLYNSKFVNCYVFFDSDKEGKDAIKKEIEEENIKSKNIYLCNCNGMKESELEDCITVDVYKDYLLSEYGIDLKVKEFKNSDKWSLRLKKCFEKQGKIWSDEIEKKVKSEVSLLFSKSSIEAALIEQKSDVIFKLIKELEENI